MAIDEQKGRVVLSEAAEKERLLKHEEAVKALGKPIYDDMKVCEFICIGTTPVRNIKTKKNSHLPLVKIYCKWWGLNESDKNYFID